jgi:hypothetical protein
MSGTDDGLVAGRGGLFAGEGLAARGGLAAGRATLPLKRSAQRAVLVR